MGDYRVAAQFSFDVKGINVETIREKLHKVLNLMERGEEGEQIAAAKILEKQLKKYGITVEDLMQKEEKRIMWFKFGNKEEKRIIFQIYCKVTGIHGEFSYQKHYRNTMTCGLLLTKAQYIEMEDLVPLFLKQYRKEIIRVKNAVLSAFINKHQLVGEANDDDEPTSSSLSEEDLNMIMGLMRGMDNVQLPYKKLNK